MDAVAMRGPDDRNNRRSILSVASSIVSPQYVIGRQMRLYLQEQYAIGSL